MAYKIIRTSARKLKIIINQFGEVSVRAPKNASLKSIDEFVEANKEWIDKTRALEQKRHPDLKRYTGQEGSRVSVFGNEYTIRIVDEGPSRIQEGELLLFSPKGDNLEALKDFYKNLTKTSILPQANRMAYLLHFVNVQFKVSSAKTTWGVCVASETNPHVRLNWRLALVPAYLTDYVIVHELCHFYFQNHSKDFWQRVSLYMPDYKERVEKLKNYNWAVLVI